MRFYKNFIVSVAAAACLLPFQSYAFNMIEAAMTEVEKVLNERTKDSQETTKDLEKDISKIEGKGGTNTALKSNVNIPDAAQLTPVVSSEMASAVENKDIDSGKKVAKDTLVPKIQTTGELNENKKRLEEANTLLLLDAYGLSLSSLKSIEKLQNEAEKRAQQVERSDNTRQLQGYKNELKIINNERQNLINVLEGAYFQVYSMEQMSKLPPQDENE
jgi:hypothetical protein